MSTDFPDVLDDILQSKLFQKRKACALLQSEMPHFIHTAARACQSLHQLRELLSMFVTAVKLKLADDTAILNVLDNDGLCALHLAILDGDVKATQNLLDLGTNSQQSTLDGNTPLSLAIAMGHSDLVSSLLPFSNVNTCDMDGDTPLMYASWRRQPAVVLKLIDAGAQINAKSVHGTTALWNAVFRSCPETVLILLQNNAKLDAKCEGTQLFRSRGDDENCATLPTVEKIYPGHKRSLLWVAADKIKDTRNYDKSLHILLMLLEAGYDVTKERWLRNISGNVPKKYPQGFTENRHLRDVLYFFHTRPQTLRDMCRNSLRNHLADLKEKPLADCLSSMTLSQAVIDYLSLKYLDLSLQS